MPAVLMDHASMSEIARDKTSQHVGAAAVPRVKEGAVTAKRRTQTLDYIWRSGVAGGIAGCAVSTKPGKLA